MNRRLIKRDMILFRVHKHGKVDWQGSCWCDYCQTSPAFDMHEIYSRGRSEKDEDLRNLSMQEELCSMLCRSCHQKSHTSKVREILIERNIETYGKERVSRAYRKDIRLERFFE